MTQVLELLYICTMNVSLTPKLESFVRETVEAGLYNNASEVVREALRLLHEKETKRKELHEALDASFKDIQAGRTTPFSRKLMDELANEVADKTK